MVRPVQTVTQVHLELRAHRVLWGPKALQHFSTPIAVMTVTLDHRVCKVPLESKASQVRRVLKALQPSLMLNEVTMAILALPVFKAPRAFLDRKVSPRF